VPAAQITAAPNAAERRVLCDTIIVVSVSSQVPAWRSMLGLLVQYCEHLGERLQGGAAGGGCSTQAHDILQSQMSVKSSIF
jgi:hypothetical protein